MHYTVIQQFDDNRIGRDAMIIQFCLFLVFNNTQGENFYCYRTTKYRYTI